MARLWWAVTAVCCVLVTVAHLRTFSAVDPRDRAATWLRANAREAREIALLDIPWYTTPPICPWNGGVRTKQQFEEWNQTASPRILPLEWRAAPLLDAQPDFVVFADVEVKDLRRIGDARAVALDDALRSKYRLAATFDGKARIFGIRVQTASPPPDWEYVTPTTYVYGRPEAKEAEKP